MALTEEQIEMLGDRLVPLFQQLERDTINDIARRLMKTGRLTETAEIMAESLSLKGYSPSAIRREVMRLIRADAALQKRIEQDTIDYKKQLAQRIADMREDLGEEDKGLWEDAGNLAFHEDLAVWKGEAKPVKGTAFEGLVKAMLTQTSGDLLNLTKSAGFRTPDGSMFRARQAYTQELNRALVKLSSGAFSWQKCVEDAVHELAGSGLRTVDFDSGVSRQIDTAVRNAVMTASAQLAGQISMANAEQSDTDYVEVSSHWGARTGEGHANHAAWQGKVYKIHGSEPGYDNLEEATGYPSDPRGLLGYNCRHVFYPFWPGLSEPQKWPPEPAPVTVDGKTYTYYEATQEQRRREREIRALKREESALTAAGLDAQAKEKRALIRQKTGEYEDFSRDVGIRAKNERLRVCEGTSGAGEMFRAAQTHQKTGERGNKIIPQPLYNKLTKPFIKSGGLILRGGDEVEKHLDIENASASQIANILMFRSEPSISEVLEELHHWRQVKKNLNADKPEMLKSILNEIDAKKYLLSVADKYKIPSEETMVTVRHLADYEKMLEDYERENN